MKAILISDHAKWCALMMNGKKKVEIRKGTALYKATQKLIDEYGYADIYVYCTKAYFIHETKGKMFPVKRFLNNEVGFLPKRFENIDHPLFYDLRGKVIFKFRCYKVEEIANKDPSCCKIDGFYYTLNLSRDKLEKVSCLSFDEINGYLKAKLSTAIYISSLKIFDRPKEVSEFYPYCKDEKCEYRKNHCSICYRTPLTKAPQSWCYVEKLSVMSKRSHRRKCRQEKLGKYPNTKNYWKKVRD